MSDVHSQLQYMLLESSLSFEDQIDMMALFMLGSEKELQSVIESCKEDAQMLEALNGNRKKKQAIMHSGKIDGWNSVLKEESAYIRGMSVSK